MFKSRLLSLSLFIFGSLVSAFAIVTLGSHQSAFAAGESYKWSSNGTTIIASGGIYSGPTTIEKITNGPNSGKWNITSDSTLSFQRGKCGVGSRAGTSPLYTVSADNKTISWTGTWAGGNSCAQPAGNQGVPGGSISGSPGSSTGTGPTSPQSCGSYSNGTKEYSACLQGKQYTNDYKDTTQAEAQCDKQALGGESNTASLITACKAGVQLALMPALFASVRDAACNGESGGTAATCQSTFDKALDACIAADPNLASVKTCLKATYPNLASQIDSAQVTGTTGPGDPTCESIVKGIGWFACPIITAIGDVADGVWGAVQGLLEAQPLLEKNADGTPSGYFVIWGQFLSFANVALVITFLFIIYSQLTSAGIGNYGIKKMLPKLLIVAVLINASFYIVAALIDLFNIIGNSLYAVIGKVSASAPADFSWTGLIGVLITAGGAVTAGAVAFAVVGAEAMFFIIVPFMLAAIVGVITALVTLMFRQAIIPILAILAPIALVCLLLPNMEQWFTRWRKMFFAMLMLYPIAAVLFAGLQLAGKLIAGAPDAGTFGFVMGLVVMSLPLFMIPFIAAKTEGFLGQMNSKLTGATNRIGNSVQNWSKDRAGNAKDKYEAGMLSAKKGELGLGQRFRRGFLERKHNRTIDSAAYRKQSEAGLNQEYMGRAEETAAKMEAMGMGTAAGYTRTIGVDMKSKAENEAVEQSMTALRNKGKAGDVVSIAQQQLTEAHAKGDVVGARAATRVLAKETGSRGVDALYKTLSGLDKGDGLGKIDDDVRHEVNGAGLKGQNRSLDMWARDEKTRDVIDPTTGKKSKKGISLSDYSGRSDVVSSLNESELANHSVNQLRRYGSVGAISQDHAQRILNANSQGTLPLDQDKLEIFTDIVAGRAVNPPNGG